MKLSVAMCTYNGAKYIEEQLLSILNQELPIHEIVVCDDGSIDNTIEIVNRIASVHTELSWVIMQNAPNLGLIKNFEKAINNCHGDVIFLSDQDDIWQKNKTKEIVGFLEKNKEIDVVFTDAEIVDSNGNSITKRSLLDAWLLLPSIDLWESGLCLEIMMFCNRATGATMAFRKSCIQSFLPFDEDPLCLHDYQIAMYGCIHQSIGLIKKRLIKYRQHETNVQGVSRNNWIYKMDNPSSLLLEAIEPVKIRHFCQKYKSSRLDFYNKRVNNYNRIIGKLKLLVHIPQYVRFYNRYWKAFLLSDLFYGINAKIREKLIRMQIK